MIRKMMFAAAAFAVSVAHAQVWTETQILEPTDAAVGSLFGFNGAIDDGWVASLSGDGDGRVLFVERVGPGEWADRQLMPTSPVDGGSIAISGSVVVVGQEGGPAPDNTGVAMIFERDDNGLWSQTAVLRPDDLLDSAGFGRFVAASGDRVAVHAGFAFASEARDAIYVFRREGFGQWVLEDRISLFDETDPNDQRYAMTGFDMDGDTIVLFEAQDAKGFCISMRFEAYERDGNNQWSLRSRIQEDNRACAGGAIATHGDIAVVFDPMENNTGGARVYRRIESGSWIRGEDLIPGDAAANAFIGVRLDFDGRTLVMSGPPAFFNSQFSVFEVQPDGTFADLGVQTSPTFPPGINSGYGESIGVDGDDLFVGAPAAFGALPDTFEKGAIAFYDRAVTNTDTDGDELPDDWEENGIPYAKSDGTTGRLILPQADPLRRNMYIEVDAALIPMPESAMDLVVEAFARAPVFNPDGSTGITLHIDLDENDVPTPNAVVNGDSFPANFESLRQGRFGTTEERGDDDAAALLEAKAKAYRWCFAYSGIKFQNRTGYFGRGDLPGSNFLIDLDHDLFDVVLHPDTAPMEVASTFMHEFGHTLGLRHGGSDNIQGKPNYPSIMNYALVHRYPWNRSFRRLDFSREQLPFLDESALVESAGINSAGYRRFRMPFGVGPAGDRRFAFVRLTGRATDFNGDGLRQGTVTQDLNFMPTIDFPGVGNASPDQDLPGQNDWAVIRYAPVPSRGGEQSSGCTNPDVYEFMTTRVPPPCEVDLDESGVINFFDIAEFLTAFNASDTEVDLAEPFGVFDAADVQAYIDAYLAGCQ